MSYKTASCTSVPPTPLHFCTQLNRSLPFCSFCSVLADWVDLLKRIQFHNRDNHFLPISVISLRFHSPLVSLPCMVFQQYCINLIRIYWYFLGTTLLEKVYKLINRKEYNLLNLIFILLQRYIFKRFCSFIFSGEGREKKRERNINVWLPLGCHLLGTWPTTQACALTGIEPAALWFAGWHSIHRDTPART